MRLTDAERSALLWSEQYEEGLEDIFALQDAITRDLVGRLAVRLADLERQRTFASRPRICRLTTTCCAGASSCATPLGRRTSRPAACSSGRRRSTPTMPPRSVNLGSTYMHEVSSGSTGGQKPVMARAEELAETALDLDPASAEASVCAARC